MNNLVRAVLGPVIGLAFACLTATCNPVWADSTDDIQGDALRAMIANKAAIRAGRAKAQTCTRCHGRDGIHRLALRAGWKGSDGQFAIAKLREFRDGKVSHQVMSAVAAGLKETDILQIAQWLDSLSSK
ncbi:MAG: cytochrome c [Granulosicoccus sp.]